MKNTKSLTLASLSAAIGITLLPSISSAQHRDYNRGANSIFGELLTALLDNGTNRRGYGGFAQDNRTSCPNFRKLGQYITALDTNADQMLYRYSMELRSRRPCSQSNALISQMRTHQIVTDRLAQAYLGNCVTAFRKAACDVEVSSQQLNRLHRNIPVSEVVCRLINEASVQATWIHANSRFFVVAPVIPQPPVYSSAYFELGNQVNLLSSWSVQMLNEYSREAACGCKESQRLLGAIREYNQATNRLNNAYRGTCPVTFTKSAREVRDSLSYVQSVQRKARVGSHVNNLIVQSCPRATYVRDNACQFRPWTNQQNPQRWNTPVYGDSFGRIRTASR